MHKVSHQFLNRYRPDRRVNWDQRRSDQVLRLERQQPIFDLAELTREDIFQILLELAEPSYQEAATGAFVSDFLLRARLRLDRRSGVLPYETEVIFAESEQIATAIRCDLDAVSSHGSCSHTCGHATNMAAVSLLAAALSEKGQKNIGFIFQPAEEGPGNEMDGYVHPQGFGGGQYLRAKGIYEKVDQLISCHVDTALNDNQIRLSEGPATAAAYRIRHVAKGTVGHAALIDEGNPLEKSAELIVESMQLRSMMRALNSGTISMTRTNTSPGELNTIPRECVTEGISRIVGMDALNAVKRLVDKYGAELMMEAPPVINHPDLVTVARKVAAKYGFSIEERPATFRDETAWAGPFELPWADPKDYPPGCNKILHFFTPPGRPTGGLHSQNFRVGQEAIDYQMKMLRGIIDELS